MDVVEDAVDLFFLFLFFLLEAAGADRDGLGTVTVTFPVAFFFADPETSPERRTSVWPGAATSLIDSAVE